MITGSEDKVVKMTDSVRAAELLGVDLKVLMNSVSESWLCCDFLFD